ncbi:hypothetical protein DFJ58DRAFT_733214 [Suillus subalutaceus]|uniref:uncharacterized protein n=1 Tax=Suillus subalutaceus TaxID=48586 RepID=UPI001B869A95|nr:uncharacterized protein DFJ58DRAFT_733214 [Suillus subalutaceus]KAG1839615.1 hypothetical protein DFJ58DRAFT_733214 [Suillus subalutaceus]
MHESIPNTFIPFLGYPPEISYGVPDPTHIPIRSSRIGPQQLLKNLGHVGVGDPQAGGGSRGEFGGPSCLKERNYHLEDQEASSYPSLSQDTENSSSTFTSTASSPLDTLETNKRQLTPDEEEPENREVSDQEVNEDLREDDEESLPDAPKANTILLPAFQWDTDVHRLSLENQALELFHHQLTLHPCSMDATTKTQLTSYKVLKCTSLSTISQDEVIMILLLGTFISAGSDADVWWTGLGAAHKATWVQAKVAFLTKWPAIVVAGKTQREYQKDLLELRFKEEEVGERVTGSRDHNMGAYLVLQQAKMLVKDTGVENVPILIQPVDWDAFLNKIKNININTLQEKAKRVKERKEMERAQNACIMRLESRQDPIEVLCLQMQQTTIGSNTLTPKAAVPPRTMGNTPPSAMTLQRAVHYMAANQSTTNQYPRGQPPMQEEKGALRTYVNELQHHIDTDTGHTAYGEQLRQWTAKWGEGARCTEKTPFPLTPGTAQICSGECFRCGVHGYIRPRCPIPTDAQLPKNESIWRSNCT